MEIIKLNINYDKTRDGMENLVEVDMTYKEKGNVISLQKQYVSDCVVDAIQFILRMELGLNKPSTKVRKANMTIKKDV